MMNIRLYDVVEVTSPVHDKTGMRGVVSGMLSVDGDIVSYEVNFADGIEIVDPEDVDPTGKSVEKSAYESGSWPISILEKESSGS